MNAIQLILALIGIFVIPCIIYVVLIIKLVQALCCKRGEVDRGTHQEDNSNTGTYPILRIVGSYVGAIWITVLLVVSSFMVAIHGLHAIERSDVLGNVIFLILPYSLVLIVITQKFTRIFASKRQERPFHTHRPIKIYKIGIVAAIIIFFTFQERNPLDTYGVAFEWYDPADEPGQYHVVHLIRHFHGQTISGPLCGGQYPKVTFSDENQDGIDDIMIHTIQGKEVGVFSIVEPYTIGEPAFKIIRGAEDTCPIPSNPPFAEFLKVRIF